MVSYVSEENNDFAGDFGVSLGQCSQKPSLLDAPLHAP